MTWQRKIPFGYMMRNGEILCCPTESAAVKEIFRLYSEGMAYSKIADEMMLRGIAYHKHTDQWNKHMVKRILENERYLGEKEYPPIIESETFMRVQLIRGDKNTYTPCPEYIKPIREKAVCGVCGGKMARDTRASNKVRWYCQTEGCANRRYIEDEDTHTALTGRLNALAQKPDLFVWPLPQQAGEMTLEAARIQNEVIRELNKAEPGVEYTKMLILACAAEKYSGLPDYTPYHQELATLLYSFAESQSAQLPSGTSKDFTDAAQISSWATDAVTALTSAGIINGKDGNRFDPAGTATRAEAATVLVRYWQAVNGDMITTNGGSMIALSALEHETDAEDASTVYFTNEISSDALMEIYAALNWTPTGKVAVKLSTGEPPNSNYLDPNLIKALVQSVDGTIVECNTAYGGSRANTAMHMQVAEDHGFTAIADVDILDADGSMSLPVTGGTQLTEDLVGSHFADYDSYLVLSHFKGHAMAGFGGAIKNISIGLGSVEGKCLIHTAGENHTNPFAGEQDSFLESMGDAGKAVSDYLGNGDRIVYISVMNRLSIDCDCNGNPAEPDMHDIGILASTDPVALDQACIDLVYASEERDSLVERIEGRNGLHTLENAEEIGLGSRAYNLVSIDE